MPESYVYFDHNSTTPTHPSVVEVMLDFFSSKFGNASSSHSFGHRALEAVEEAREQVAKLIGVDRKQVIFTSGGTESNNLVIRGLAESIEPGSALFPKIEHPCVEQPMHKLKKSGWDVGELSVKGDGTLDIEDLIQKCNLSTRLIGIMLANNETGVCQPLAEATSSVRDFKTFIHTDAVQAVGKIPVNFEELGVQSMSLSAHKLNGPKGVGALILGKKVIIEPLIVGGGHESGLRSGTLNVPAIVGFGKACELAFERVVNMETIVKKLRGRLETKLLAIKAEIFGLGAKRLPNTTYFSLPGIYGETLVLELDKAGFAVSSGAACSSAGDGVSKVLTSMGIDENIALGAVRVSLGPENTMEEIDAFCSSLSRINQKLTSLVSMAY